MNLYTSIKTHNSTKDIKKSTALTKTAEVGSISRGKYILLTMCSARTIDSALLCMECEKYCQGSSAENTIIGYGAVPSLGSLATRPNITVKIIMLNSGRITLHATPITVCLYLTRISRHAIKKKSSLNFRSSSTKSAVVLLGSMIKSNSPSFGEVSIFFTFSRIILIPSS